MINNTFSGNLALYGNNVGSYVTQIYIHKKFNQSIVFDNVGSGIKYPDPITLALYDDDEQVVLNSVSQIVISGISKTDRIEGTNTVKVAEGLAVFNSIVFISEPGKSQIWYQISSPAISLANLKLVYGSDYQISKLMTNFRFCKPGERIADNSGVNSNINRIWETWSPGTYSLDWNSTTCINWVQNSNCIGGEEINVNSGYWRLTTNSTIIVACPNPDA